MLDSVAAKESRDMKEEEMRKTREGEHNNLTSPEHVWQVVL